MFTQYNIKNNIAGIQNILISESIKENSNIQLLKSEEAVKDVIKSYADRFEAVGGKLTNISKHYARGKDIIDVKLFNALFDTLYLDIKTLYKEIEFVDEILNLNLGRNKKFFNILKKRMRELWNKLHLTRLNINDSSTFDESYFESFSTIATRHKYSNVLIDKKSGIMTLVPKKIRIQNKKYLIKNINSQTYPVHNTDGGVIFTSSYLNSFSSSYRRDGQRDMLENGLWKEQVLCNDIPEIKYNLNDNEDRPLYKTFTGLISLVDIEYVYPVEINNIEIDVFGDYPTGLIAIFTKNTSDELWVPMKKLVTDERVDNFDYVDNFKPISKFDIIDVRNLEIVKAKFIRLVFNQTYFDLLDTTVMKEQSVEDKINEDLSERRYEVVKLDGGADDRPAVSKSYDNDSLYSKITDVIEMTRSVEETLDNIIKILEPPPELLSIEFKKTLKYELGAWSIEPTSKKYQGTGKFDSGDYYIRDKSLLTVNLTTKQESIKYTTCNWYVSHPEHDVPIPIIENNQLIRKEVAHIVRPKYYENLGWNNGYLIHLDFPASPGLWASSKLYINGTAVDMTSLTYYMFNSTLVYIENISDPLKNDYVIQYMPASFSSVNVYILEKVEDFNNSDPKEFNIITPRMSILTSLIDRMSSIDVYNVKKSRCTQDEYYRYFLLNKNICLTFDAFNTIQSDHLGALDPYATNIVQQLRSITYDEWLTGGYAPDMSDGSILPSATPIKIERDIR